MLSLAVGEYRLTVTNDPPHYDGSADNVHNYDVTHSFDGDSCAATSGHALRLFQHDHQIRSALLSASGGASGVHDHTAIIIDGRNCIIAVGPYMASVSIPSLNLNWATQTDEATCFGVYESLSHDCLLSHGELFIARVTYGGTIAWQAGGADIFTNGFQLDGDVIHVTDFCGRDYTIDIKTGREIVS